MTRFLFLPHDLRAAAIALACAALLAAGCSSRSHPVGPAGPAGTWLGLVANPARSAPADSFASAFFTARATGVNLLSYGIRWSDFEPSPGVFATTDLRGSVSMARAFDMGLYVTLHVLETNQRALPADLAGRSFSDATLLERLDRAVDTLAAVVKSGSTIAVALGNEVDVYFGTHPGEFEGFKVLVAREVARLHARLPRVPVGVTTTSPVDNPNAGYGDQLNFYADVAIYTYYPFQPGTDFQHRPVTTFGQDMAAMIARAADKPVAFQEVGYSSAAANGSSEGQQADFVRRFRDYVAGSLRRDVLFADWYLYTDLDSATVDTLLGFYGHVSPGFRAYLANLGLRRADGTPKASWSAWRGLP